MNNTVNNHNNVLSSRSPATHNSGYIHCNEDQKNNEMLLRLIKHLKLQTELLKQYDGEAFKQKVEEEVRLHMDQMIKNFAAEISKSKREKSL